MKGGLFCSQHPRVIHYDLRMMSAENQNVIYLLFGAVALLFFNLIGVLVVSQLRRQLKEHRELEAKQGAAGAQLKCGAIGPR